jgi:hypothetical protein
VTLEGADLDTPGCRVVPAKEIPYFPIMRTSGFNLMRDLLLFLVSVCAVFRFYRTHLNLAGNQDGTFRPANPARKCLHFFEIDLKL